MENDGRDRAAEKTEKAVRIAWECVMFVNEKRERRMKDRIWQQKDDESLSFLRNSFIRLLAKPGSFQ
jgi:hypothetical protein